MAIAVQRSRDVRFYETLPLAVEPLSVEPVQKKTQWNFLMEGNQRKRRRTMAIANQQNDFFKLKKSTKYEIKTAKNFEISHLNLN